MVEKRSVIEDLKESLSGEKGVIQEIIFLSNFLERTNDSEEKKMIISQIDSLKKSLRQSGKDIPEKLKKIILIKTLYQSQEPEDKKEPMKIESEKEKSYPKINLKKEHTIREKIEDSSREIRLNKPEKVKLSELERDTLKRIKKIKRHVIVKKEKKPSKYIKTANKIFSNLAESYQNKAMFKNFEKDLIKANMRFIPSSYISVIFFTTLLSIIAAGIIFTFLLFFNIGPALPIITRVPENIGARFVKVLWVLIFVPLATFLLLYLYPSLEKRSIGNKISAELPFAAIHMSSIGGSISDPSKIFNIMIATHEYPYLEKEFIKLINEINIYGYDLVTALRNIASNSPSEKLSDLLNGMAITITSGGSLSEFFDKRSQSLLLDYRLEREKRTKAAETFMDIYISVVIAAPMILMLLLIMMKISGLGISLSTSAITLIMILAVSGINILFIVFLHLRQPKE